MARVRRPQVHTARPLWTRKPLLLRIHHATLRSLDASRLSNSQESQWHRRTFVEIVARHASPACPRGPSCRETSHLSIVRPHQWLIDHSGEHPTFTTAPISNKPFSASTPLANDLVTNGHVPGLAVALIKGTETRMSGFGHATDFGGSPPEPSDDSSSRSDHARRCSLRSCSRG